MDELEISGKRYISSRRAAKENKYHSDYIGQLIRAGKVAGSKVGRAWYVDAQSLAAYLGTEKVENPQFLKYEEKVTAPEPVEEQEEVVVVIKKTEPEPEVVKNIQTIYEAQPRTTLRYISADQPLFRPTLSREKPSAVAPMPLRVAVSTPTSSEIKRANNWGVGRLALLSSLALVGFGLFFVFSLFLQYNLSVQGTSDQASVGFSTEALNR